MKLILAILAVSLALSPVAAGAQSAAAPSAPAASVSVPGTVRDGPVVARLAVEQVSIQPGKSFTAALVLTMDPDWHVYWKYPGDSGLPTTVSWDLPPGWSAGPLQWPVPQRFVTQDLVTYGYAGRVLLMAQISVPPGATVNVPVKIRARVGWLACRVECTPGKAQVEMTLPVLARPPSRDPSWAAAFDDARSNLPAAATAQFSAAADGGSVTLTIPGSLLPPGVQASFYPGSEGQVKVSAPQQLTREGARVRLRMPRDPGAARIDRLSGLLVTTGFGAPKALDVDAPVAASREGAGLLAAILLAFLGGLILNLMPCVLPVISLKALSVLRQGGGHGARHGLLFTGGVLVSFWIIAGVLEAFRAGGRLLGWGFQFQDPAVVVIAAMLFFLMALNLFGVFEIGTVFTRLGGRLPGAGSFAGGVFATAVATPCTAPFMGAAVGFALSHSVPASLGVFSALGLGMAAPSLVLAVSPGLSARLPRPGAWMETFRQVMGFPMMAAAVWMIAVLASLTGPDGAVGLLAAMLAAGLGAWIWGRWGTLSRARRTRALAGAAALVLAVGATATAARIQPPNAPSVTAQNVSLPVSGSWEPWSAARVDELRRAGTPVFVDFTAKWCLTCLVNEKVALGNADVQKGFRSAGVVTLRADWTSSSDEISQGLASFGRASVPLYVYYPPGGRDPVILPEILTPGIVLGAIR